jgi:hypothetical protein
MVVVVANIPAPTKANPPAEVTAIATLLSADPSAIGAATIGLGTSSARVSTRGIDADFALTQ